MTRRFEAVCLAIKGYSLAEIGRRLGVSGERVRQMIVRQAGCDFHEQLRLERGQARWTRKEVMPE